MANARTLAELQSWSDLTVIRRALEAKLPDASIAVVGLRDIAEVCRRDHTARPGRDFNVVRDQLLLIGAEWDLTQDQLDQQSATCLRAIADFLR